MKRLSDSRLLLLLIVVFAIPTAQALVQGLPEDGINVWRSRWSLPVVLIAGTGFLAAVIFLLSFHPPSYRKLCRFVEANLSNWPVWQWLVWFAFFASPLIYAWLFTFSSYRQLTIFQPAWFKLSGGLFLTSLFSLLMKSVWKKRNTGLIFLSGLLFQSVTLKIASLLTRVSASPFVLTWEESHRIYYASLLASERLYGIKAPLDTFDFSLNLLNGVPFLLGDFPIWAHRLWYVLLTIGIAFLTAWALAQRLKLSSRWHYWLLIAFAWLYLLMEGGVKYNLQVSVVLVLLTFSPHHPWRSLAGIALASFWAGLSRVHWVSVPAMLAVGLYLLEKPAFRIPISQYLAFPISGSIVGLISAMAGLWVVSTSPNYTYTNASARLSQDFLWYRLLPNATYAPGILIPLLLVSVPLWYLILRKLSQIHWLRQAGLIGMLLILLAVGIVVSAKIGGGSDLHNLDAYFVLMLIAASYALFDCFAPDRAEVQTRPLSASMLSWMLALALVVPVGSVFKGVTPYRSFDPQQNATILAKIQAEIDKVPDGQEILFMYQRPLIVFGYLNVDLVPDYENALVFEAVFARNQDYLEQFRRDLCDHRFGLIVTDPQPNATRGRGYGFGEENDIWFNTVTQMLLQSYVRAEEFPEVGIELYVPLQNACQPDNQSTHPFLFATVFPDVLE